MKKSLALEKKKKKKKIFLILFVLQKQASPNNKNVFFQNEYKNSPNPNCQHVKKKFQKKKFSKNFYLFLNC